MDAKTALKQIQESGWRTKRIDGHDKHYNKYDRSASSDSLPVQGNWRVQVLLKMKPPLHLTDAIKSDARASNVKLYWDSKVNHFIASTWFYCGTDDKKPAVGELSKSDMATQLALLRASEAQGLFFKTYGKYAVGSRVNTVQKR